jgi:ubiquinone/menaquinone biosynthesis C-methylase UbiE
MVRNLITSPTEAGLSALYARFADRWHASISKLGFPAAYAMLMDHDAACRRRDGVSTPHKVLDAGTGSGAMADAVLAQYPCPATLVLLDNSDEMLAQARDMYTDYGGALHIVNAGMRSDTLPRAAYDTITSAHLAEHTPDPAAIFQTFYDMLAPGGVLVLAVSKPHWCTAIVRWRWGHKAYRPEQVVAMLQTAGFDRIDQVPFASGPPGRLSCGYRAVKPE